MDPKASPEKPDLSFSDHTNDPEEKDISEGEGEGEGESEGEDDDRNHKHRKREAGSQSLEGDTFDQVLTRPYGKRKHFETRLPSREGNPQSGETWRSHSAAPEKDYVTRFEKRRPNRNSFPRASQDLNRRTSGNQSLSAESLPVRGRGMDRLSWGMHNSRLGFVDVTSPIIQSGPIPSGLIGGTGMPNISNAHSTPWNTFGLVPGVPNGVLDGLHPFGLQGTLRPPIAPVMNIGIPRQRCRDFEERGFCLRGDMCPMEHGINRIVVEDVQSLSQFNLPVSLPGSQLPGTSRNGSLPVINSYVKNKAFQSTSRNSEPAEDGLGLNGDITCGFMPGGSDVYDPDQPLWTNDNIVTPPALLEANDSNTGVKESLLGKDPSGLKFIESGEENYEQPVTSVATAVSQSFSDLGKLAISKNRFGQKDTSSVSLEHVIKSEDTPNAGSQYVPQQGNSMDIDGNGPQARELTLKQNRTPVSNVRKPSQKALRTLYVNGIPLKDNKKDALLTHFEKFGEVIDIYIPINSEKAFVRFLKKEDAEAALTSPDAVMGNRFIKIFWANRDNSNDFGSSAPNGVPFPPYNKTLNPALSKTFAPDRGNETLRLVSNKDDDIHPSIAQVPIYDRLKPISPNASKTPPVQQKKLENIEHLREEIRKKQEMLEKKRNEFRLELDKIEKQSVGSKDTLVSDQTTKRLEGETATGHETETANASSLRCNAINEMGKSSDHAVSNTTASKPSLDVHLLSMRPLARPLAPTGGHSTGNRFKLDNRPTTFRTVSPLPAGLANVATLKEHFSTYGDLSSVELEEPDISKTNDNSLLTCVSARISFATRRSAERAFSSGKNWQGHNLQFMWVKSTNPGKQGDGSTSSNIPSSADAQPVKEATTPPSQKSGVVEISKLVHLTSESGTESMDENKGSEQPSTSASSKNDIS